MTSPTEALAHALAEQREKILAMVAGPELDKKISLTIFGQLPFTWPGHSDLSVYNGEEVTPHITPLPPYSTDPGAAWLVIEVVRAQWGFRIEDTPEAWITVTIGRQTACAETFPLAACRAALLARLETGPS